MLFFHINEFRIKIICAVLEIGIFVYYIDFVKRINSMLEIGVPIDFCEPRVILHFFRPIDSKPITRLPLNHLFIQKKISQLDL